MTYHTIISINPAIRKGSGAFSASRRWYPVTIRSVWPTAHDVGRNPLDLSGAAPDRSLAGLLAPQGDRVPSVLRHGKQWGAVRLAVYVERQARAAKTLQALLRTCMASHMSDTALGMIKRHRCTQQKPGSIWCVWYAILDSTVHRGDLRDPACHEASCAGCVTALGAFVCPCQAAHQPVQEVAEVSGSVYA